MDRRRSKRAGGEGFGTEGVTSCSACRVNQSPNGPHSLNDSTLQLGEKELKSIYILGGISILFQMVSVIVEVQCFAKVFTPLGVFPILLHYNLSFK